ncbi:3-hydroxy-9,10-secoandrosta-1,3,5(10)-triene-9,17-dione monooxygenase oxygenase subunit [Streptomyces sp. SYSU K217416]
MSHDEVLAAVRGLAPVLRERAAEAEELRQVPDDSIKEIEETGFFRLMQPRAYGGYAADPVIFYEAVKEIARACGSTGWATSLLGVSPWHVALFAAEAQEEVWGENRTTRIASSYAPTGKVTPVDGGFRLSGRWRFCAGCDHAGWALLGGLVVGEDGVPADMRTFLVPKTEYAVDPVWDTVGLRGSGSHDIVVEDAFVPRHRALSFGPVIALRGPGQELNDEPLYRMPYAAVFSAAISTPIVGIADGAYASCIEATKQRFRVSYGQKVAEDPFAQVRIARAAGDIDASWLQLTHNIAELYALARRGGEIPMELRARARRDQVLATERAVAAVDLLMENAGGSAMRTGPDPVQRAWRDAHTGRGHAANEPERALMLFGRMSLGLDIQTTEL